MNIEFEINDELVDEIISNFCAEHIRICNNDIADYKERMLKEELREYERRDFADTIKHRACLVGVYNYCNAEKWKD